MCIQYSTVHQVNRHLLTLIHDALVELDGNRVVHVEVHSYLLQIMPPPSTLQ